MMKTETGIETDRARETNTRRKTVRERLYLKRLTASVRIIRAHEVDLKVDDEIFW